MTSQNYLVPLSSDVPSLSAGVTTFLFLLRKMNLPVPAGKGVCQTLSNTASCVAGPQYLYTEGYMNEIIEGLEEYYLSSLKREMFQVLCPTSLNNPHGMLFLVDT